MAIAAPASLDSTALSRRLGELAGHERRLQLEFLLHLDEFDRRRAWAEAAGRRIAAMRVLRRFPALGDALSDGRLCLSTVAVTWKVEVDHIEPVALGGRSTIDNCRLLCASHNQLHAEQSFGRAHVERYRRKQPRKGEIATPGGGGGEAPPALAGM
jgi:5-methylcytosine-specific restriction endonuclease McrA